MNLDAATIASWLNRLPFVRWDRYLRVPVGGDSQYEMLTVYGWIDRDDGRSDFVVLEFPSYDDTPGFCTSSVKHSAAINTLLYKDVDPLAPHYECQRVDDFVGDLVPNRVAPFAPGRGKPPAELDEQGELTKEALAELDEEEERVRDGLR